MHPFQPRSLLYLPVTSDRFLRKAIETGADALVLDLEDSIAAGAKLDARAALASAVPRVLRRGAHVTVRVNSTPALLADDLRAAVAAGCEAIVLPKVERAQDLTAVDAILLEAERRGGLAEGSVRIQAVIETPAALFALPEITAASRRVVSLAYGCEDFALALGVEPSMEAMRIPAQMVVFAACAVGLHSAGLAGTIGNYSDLDTFRTVATLSRQLGLQGAGCIHPAQIGVVNEIFGATAAQIDEAQSIVSLYDERIQAGSGAFAFNGKMIDAPIAERARALLRRAGAHA